jgi:hypothetical protein
MIKRVESSQQTMKLYHLTDPANLSSIRKHGLRPHVADDAKVGKVIWLTTRERQPGEKGDGILTVELDRADPLLKCIEDLGLSQWWIYRGVIAPDSITFP